MSKRPNLTKELDEETFRNYYSKEELVTFCKENNIPAIGNKSELTTRVSYFLSTRKILEPIIKKVVKNDVKIIDKNTIIEPNIVCSQIHRTFFKEKIGNSFSFNVLFQKWLKENAGKSYGDAVKAYYQILENKKNSKTTIDKQFEYNAYIRAFFENNHVKSLEDAIKCWKYKKSIPGHNRYEQSDLMVLVIDNIQKY